MQLRTLRLLIAAAIVGTAAASAAGSGVGAAQPPPCGGSVKSAGAGWLSLHPGFDSGSAKVTIAKSPAYAPSALYATNGSELMGSADAGCTWRKIITPTGSVSLLPIPVPAPLDGLLQVPATATITAVSTPSSATSPNDYVYIGVTNNSPVGEQPQIIVVGGSGQSTTPTGLPRLGKVAELTASDVNPKTAYAVISGGGTLGDDGLYVTQDGGQTWTKRGADVSGLHNLQVNPLVVSGLFAQGSRGVYMSLDGGASFDPPRLPTSDISMYDVAFGGGYIRLVQGHKGSKVYDRSDDGGLSWGTQRSPVVTKQVAMQPLLDNVAVSDGHRLYLEMSGKVKKAHNVTPQVGVPTQLQFTAPVGTGYALTGIAHNAIVRSVFNFAGKPVKNPDPLTPVALLPHAPPHQFPATLLPGSKMVTIKPGHHADVHYRLLLPRTPSPVDVMFLIDTTSSTEHTINGLRQDLAGIVNDLASTGLNAEFGVAGFRDYPPIVQDKGAGETGDHPYTLDRVIGLDNASLRAAIDKLHAGGGGDPAEADLTALYQSTTGVGQKCGRCRGGYIVQPGQDAHYRSDSLKLAVLATDNPFHRERNYLTPSWASTVAALRAHQVHPIGLAVQTTDDTGKPSGFRSLPNEREMAIDTGSLAPTGGVDCNGDLRPDITAGGPFVCKVPLQVSSTANIGGIQVQPKIAPVKLAPAIVTAAETLPDMRTISLGVTGAAGIARVIAPAPLPRVNLKNDNTLGYTVRYTCPKAKQRHVYQFGLTANDGYRGLASARTTVACAPIVIKPQPPHHVVPPAAIAALPPAAAAAAPPAPGNPVPNANPNPNPVPNANVGFASQEEEQKQLAFADADFGADETTELAMSRPTSSDYGGDLWFGGAALLLTAAAGYAARTRFSAAWHRN